MGKRAVCNLCTYPLDTCICEHIEAVELPNKVVIIQHPSEAKHNKNTVRLLTLIATNIIVLNSRDTRSLDALRDSLDLSRCLLLYPSELSLPLEGLQKSEKEAVDTLIFLDASWKQAFGIWQTIDWLINCQQIHFNDAPLSQYSIRKSKKAFQLSTLEAVAYSNQVLSSLSQEPFYKALNALQHHWIRHQ